MATVVRLGFAAMSSVVKHASASQTITHARFSKMKDREAAVRLLERTAASNLENCLRLLYHCAAHDIAFFRLSSRIIPLAGHPDLPDWNYIRHLKDPLMRIAVFLHEHPKMRVDFHPDHFVVLNTHKAEVLKASIQTLRIHEKLLKGMGIHPTARCVLHAGGGAGDKEGAMEQFIHNWGLVPASIQKMIILENDDKVFGAEDILYLSQKLGVPFVFDYHHHQANHSPESEWSRLWSEIADTWKDTGLPPKMHISSPKSEKDFRAHADYVVAENFLEFLQEIKGSVPAIDCMLEAKKTDAALFRLIQDLVKYPEIEQIDGASFYIK